MLIYRPPSLPPHAAPDSEERLDWIQRVSGHGGAEEARAALPARQEGGVRGDLGKRPFSSLVSHRRDRVQHLGLDGRGDAAGRPPVRHGRDGAYLQVPSGDNGPGLRDDGGALRPQGDPGNRYGRGDERGPTRLPVAQVRREEGPADRVGQDHEGALEGRVRRLRRGVLQAQGGEHLHEVGRPDSDVSPRSEDGEDRRGVRGRYNHVGEDAAVHQRGHLPERGRRGQEVRKDAGRPIEGRGDRP